MVLELRVSACTLQS